VGHADRRVLIWDSAVGDADWAAAMGRALLTHAGQLSPENVTSQAWQSPLPTQDLAELLPMLMLALAVAPDLGQRIAFLTLPPLCFLTHVAHTHAAIVGQFTVHAFTQFQPFQPGHGAVSVSACYCQPVFVWRQ